jgi:hypothetical protein
MRFTKLPVFIQLAFVAAASVVLAAEPADFVFTNGRVYTVNNKQPWAEAVAIKGNK